MPFVYRRRTTIALSLQNPQKCLFQTDHDLQEQKEWRFSCSSFRIALQCSDPDLHCCEFLEINQLMLKSFGMFHHKEIHCFSAMIMPCTHNDDQIDPCSVPSTKLSQKAVFVKSEFVLKDSSCQCLLHLNCRPSALFSCSLVLLLQAPSVAKCWRDQELGNLVSLGKNTNSSASLHVAFALCSCHSLTDGWRLANEFI